MPRDGQRDEAVHYYDASDLPTHSFVSLTPRDGSQRKRQALYTLYFKFPLDCSPPLMTQGPALEPAMTDDDLKTRTNDFVHALAASNADVANISAERTEQGMRVTFDLLDPDHVDLVRDVADEHGFEQYDDNGERFESQS